jgi:DNA topoisomerase I
VIIRTGRFGKFLSCSKFPDCKYTAPFTEETKLDCPKDSGKIIIKKTKKGRKFYGCSNYPNCDFAAWRLDQIKKQSEVETASV